MNRKKNRFLDLSAHLGIAVMLGACLLSCKPDSKEIIPITADDGPPYNGFIPILINGSTPEPQDPGDGPFIHVPYEDVDDLIDKAFPKMAVFWFGEVTTNNNYYDVRIGYNDTALYVYVAAVDRLLWYDNTPASMNLDEWDSISLYIAPNNGNEMLANQAYLLSSGLAAHESLRSDYEKSFRWNGSSWRAANIAYDTSSQWRGPGLNDADDDRGWGLGYVIPFSSLGLTQMPDKDTVWRLGIIAHDRDYQNGTSIAPQIWPAEFEPSHFDSWGRISFGLLDTPGSTSSVQGSVLIQEGVNHAVVQDVSPGGFTVCGTGLAFWTEWGQVIYEGENAMTANIQNQRDIADWPCFAKFYLNFPITDIPENREIVRATLRLYLYGNAGEWGDPVFQPYHSLIQVGMTNNDWTENTLNWNNAPLLLENISQTWVDPEEHAVGWPGVKYEWDVTKAARSAYENGSNSLSLALYSADGAYHSGKYFSTSEMPDWNAEARPALIIEYGNP
jgi:hypothetical protein